MSIQIHQKKYERQQLGQERWKNSGGWGVWWWETGVGKTFATCDMIKKMVTHNSSYTFHIIVPSALDSEIAKQWKSTIKNVIPEEYWNNIIILTINQIMDYFNNGKVIITTLLVLDEIHEYYTDDRLRLFGKTYINTKWCLGLSANYEDVNNRYKLIEDILPVIDRIDSDEALREGYISKYIEYNLGVALSPLEADKYKELSTKVTNNLSKFGHGGLQQANGVLKGAAAKDYSLIFAIAAQNGWKKDLNVLIPEHAKIKEMWSPGQIIGYARNAMDAIRERKTLIYNSINKLKAAVDVVIRFDNLKTICFSQSTLYADSLAAHINNHYLQANPQAETVCVVYHSNLSTIVYTTPDGKQKKKGKTVLKREAIEQFRGSKRVLSTASALDRGADIPEIMLALTTSGTQNPTQYNQRKGRSVRKKEEDDIVLIVNVYAKYTIDEKWLRTRQSKSKNVVYWVDSVEDINYSPKKKEAFNIQEV